jgi:ankyrin repeat protein
LLHQAGFWGATTVLHAFKELGADPTLRNFEGKTPAEMARNASKKAEFEAAITEVFGADDAASRRELLVAAKNGDFIEALTLLNSKPHLINTQSHVSGWSVLHQAAFHGCSHALIKRLLVNGACTRLKGYYDGKTALAVLEERHPDHPAIADLRAQGAPTSHAQALTSCSICPVGYFAADAASSTCSACPAGTVAAMAGSSTCMKCLAGTYSAAAALACASCSAGRFSSAAAASCVACFAGTVSPSGASACTDCGVGRFGMSLRATVKRPHLPC